MTGVRVLGLVAASVLLTGGAGLSAQEEDTDLPTRTIRGPAACVTVDRVKDYQVIDSRTLIIWGANHKDPHKIGLFQGCPRLRGAYSIYFDTRNWDQLCGRGGEYLVVARPGMSVRTPVRRPGAPRVSDDVIEDRCSVASVEAISDDVVHELLVDGGQAAPRGPQRPDAVEVLEAPPEEPEQIETPEKQ